jgi:integrase
VWTLEQVRRILANCPEEHWLFSKATALTGARERELIALRWKHVDFDCESFISTGEGFA